MVLGCWCMWYCILSKRSIGFLPRSWDSLGQSIDMMETVFIFPGRDFKNKQTWTVPNPPQLFGFSVSWDFRLLRGLWHDLTFTATSERYSFYRFYHICNKFVMRLAWPDCLEGWGLWKSWECCMTWLCIESACVCMYMYVCTYTHT